MLNLLTDPWLPVIRRHTGRCVIRPSQIAELHGEDPIIAIDWPRPDFRIATLEFLTGLLATAFPPKDGDVWLGCWHEPPEPGELDASFRPFIHAFALDGDGPRFLQDFEDLQSDAEPIERLLIEAPGEPNNQQKYRPDGSQGTGRQPGPGDGGHGALYVSIMGAGGWCRQPNRAAWWRSPGDHGDARSLADPVADVVGKCPREGRGPDAERISARISMACPTVSSEGAAIVTPQSAHPLQCWWGMPRRIRLDFVTYDTPRPCDMTGEMDNVQAVSWRQRPRGANYAAWGREHPLTPHYQQKPKPEWLASPSAARRHRLPPLARPCARVQGWDAIAGCGGLGLA